MTLADYFAESAEVLRQAGRGWSQKLVGDAVETITTALRAL